MDQWATLQLAFQQQQQQQSNCALAPQPYHINTLLVAEPSNLSNKPTELLPNAVILDTEQRYESPLQSFPHIPVTATVSPMVNSVVASLQLTCDKITHQLNVDAEAVFQQTCTAIEDAKHSFRNTVFSLAKHLRESVHPAQQQMFGSETNPQFAQICYNVSWELLKAAQNISYELTKSLDASGKELVQVTRNAVRQLGVEIPDPLHATPEHVPPLTLPIPSIAQNTLQVAPTTPLMPQEPVHESEVRSEDAEDNDDHPSGFENEDAAATVAQTIDESTELITVKAVDVEFGQPVPLYEVNEITQEAIQSQSQVSEGGIIDSNLQEGGKTQQVKTKRKRSTLKSPKKSSFPCELCDRVFLHPKSYRFHKMRVHSTERPFQCEHCDKQFVRAYEYKRHKQVHTGKPQFKCPECPKEFYQKKSYDFHVMKNHTDQRPFVCKICNFGFVRACELRKHMITHSEEKNFACDFCERAFSREKNLLQHRAIHTGEKTHSCKICGEKFTSAWFVQRHSKTHACDIEGKVLCHYCNKPFPKEDLTDHVKSHINDKTYNCDVCDDVFPTSEALFEHRKQHLGDRPFLCMNKNCGETFAEEAELEEHRKTHGVKKRTEKPKANNTYVVCGKSVQKGRLKLHLNTHKGKKPYKCEHCPKEYHVKKSLDTHLIVKHGGTRPFPCDDCDKGFPTSYDLKKHRRIHDKQHKCSICDRAFSTGKLLIEHMTLHTGEKPFACKLCVETFARYSHLAKHCKETHGQLVSGGKFSTQEKTKK